MKMEHTECSETLAYKIQTLRLFHLHREVDAQYTYLPMKMEQTVFRNVGI